MRHDDDYIDSPWGMLYAPPATVRELQRRRIDEDTGPLGNLPGAQRTYQESPATRADLGYFEGVPKDILIEIALYLSPKDIVHLCSKHSILNDTLCQNIEFWKKKVIIQFRRKRGEDMTHDRLAHLSLEQLKLMDRHLLELPETVNVVDDVSSNNLATRFQNHLTSGRRQNWIILEVVPDFGEFNDIIKVPPIMRIKPSDFADNMVSIELWDDQYKNDVETTIPHWKYWMYGFTRKAYWEHPIPGAAHKVQIGDRYKVMTALFRLVSNIASGNKVIYYTGDRDNNPWGH